VMGPIVHDAAELTTTDRYHVVVARLRPGRTVAMAATEMEVIGARLTRPAADGDEPVADRGATAVSLNDARIDPGERTTVLILFGAVGFLLLIMCANTANLLLVRSAARVREIA